MQQKSLYDSERLAVHIIFALLVLAMLGVSIYMLQHYFEARFPTGLQSGTLCNFSSRFNCDLTTNSQAAAIMGVPIPVFSIIFCVFLLAGYIFKNAAIEGTNHFLSLVNLIGCVGLFVYSLLALGGLCPFCTLYYILSGALYFMFFKNSAYKRPSLSILVVYAVLSALPVGMTYAHVQKRIKNQASLKSSLIQQYDNLPDLGRPQEESPHKLNMATEAFGEAPIRITIFSDFQCPACKQLSAQMEPVVERYKDVANIQYMFYPLDNECNPSMKRPLHPLACRAAYLAHCAGDKFGEVHDQIFEHQQDLSASWLDQKARQLGVTECYRSPETKEQVVQMISQAEAFNITSTPTILLNGVKIEGVLPLNQLFMLLDELAKRQAREFPDNE